jgi:HD-GYP domain-containing protein (c-di-GMP phosphodiesterase class II)
VEVRTAEVVGALGLATDLGMRADFEHSVRSTWLAMRVADRLGLNEAERQQVFYVTPLLYVGCTAELATVVEAFGDEEVFRLRIAPIAYDSPVRMMRTMVSLAGSESRRPFRMVARAQAIGQLRHMPQVMRAHCEVGALHAEALGLPQHVRDAMPALYERWDGRGGPEGLRGGQIPTAVRIAQIAHDLDVQTGLRAPEDVDAVMRARAGHAFDPAIVAVALEVAPEVGRDGAASWDSVLACEPEPVLHRCNDEIDDALACLAAFEELMSPFLPGHAAAVSALAGRTASRLGLPEDKIAQVRRAGLVHDVGRVAVPVGVWERAGALGAGDWERVRLHAYQSGRVLARSPWLREIGGLVAAHHERCDGSGYHQGSPGAHLTTAARVLAAADVYCAMRADRPYRPALSEQDAARELRVEASSGRLDNDVVETLIAVASGTRRRPLTDQLTPREVDVLRLLAQGRPNKQIARTLGISVKTVDNHLQRMYAKAGVSTRAAATVWAMQRGLLG